MPSSYEELAEYLGTDLYHIAAYSRDKELWMRVWRGNTYDYEAQMDNMDGRLFQGKGHAARYAQRNGIDHRQQYIEHVIRTQRKWFIGRPTTIRILGEYYVLTEGLIEGAKINEKERR